MDDQNKSIEARLAKLEAEVSSLKSQSVNNRPNWIQDLAGIHKNDQDFDEIVRLGKEIRDAEKDDFEATGLSVDLPHTPEAIAACRPSAAAGSQLDNGATNSSLLDELATFFASGPSPNDILEFRPSPATVGRANLLLELNRSTGLDDSSRRELDQFEMAESLMRLVKARIRAGQARERS
jgi:hypothetical protein